MSIDSRILRVGIEVEGEFRVYEHLAIEVTGSKYASLTQNETIIKIANVDKEARDFLLTEGTPFNRVADRRRQRIFVEAGRQSYGVVRVFTGDITRVSVSQPPDIDLEIRALTSQYSKGDVFSYVAIATTRASQIAEAAADQLGLNLVFEASDKNIQSFSYSGPALKMLDQIQAFGGYDVYVDDEDLVL